MRKKFTPKKATSKPVPGSRFNPSALPALTVESAAIIEALTTGSVAVEAVAGSGKTTLIQQVLARTANPSSVVVAAFNRDISRELCEKLPAGCTVGTFHSLGLALIKTRYPRVEVETSKAEKAYYALTKGRNPKEVEAHKDVILKLTNLARVNLALTATEVADTATTWNLDVTSSDVDDAYSLLKTLDNAVVRDGVVDYADMIRMPSVLGLMMPMASLVCVDESQDLSAGALDVVKRYARSDTRYLIVGDPHQQINGFAGANPTAWDNALSLGRVMPLSVTFRCSLAVTTHATEMDNGRTRPTSTAIAGLVETVEMAHVADATQDDLIICRTRVPLVEMAFRLWRDNKPFQWKGTEDSNPLTAMAGKVYRYWKNSNMGPSKAEFQQLLRNFIEDNSQGENGLDPEGDIRECAVMFATQLLATDIGSTREMYDIAETLGTGKSGPSLATIHRSKGLEGRNVYILKPELMPHAKASTPWEMEQERNAIYVARTRAKANLYYVSG
jgi:DNA helicase II / ATP-dependent DNA helicase PcrA